MVPVKVKCLLTSTYRFNLKIEREREKKSDSLEQANEADHQRPTNQVQGAYLLACQSCYWLSQKVFKGLGFGFGGNLV